MSNQNSDQFPPPAFLEQRDPFKAVVLKHITTSLPREVWDQMRSRAVENKPFDASFKANPSLTPESFVHTELSEDGMSIDDLLVPSFKANAVVVGTLLDQPVYYIEGSGIYAWGLTPDSTPVYMLWLSSPAYPPGW